MKLLDQIDKLKPFYTEQKVAEECAELIKESLKFSIGSPRQSKEHLEEEIGHVNLYIQAIIEKYELSEKNIKKQTKQKIRDLEKLLKELK